MPIYISSWLTVSTAQIEYHPYVAKESQPILDFQKDHEIVTSSYGGLSPINRLKGGPIDPVLEAITQRMRDLAGKPVTEAQVLQLWLRKKGVPCITYVYPANISALCKLMCNSTSSKPERLQEYLAVGSLPDLSDADEAEIDKVSSTEHRSYFVSALLYVTMNHTHSHFLFL
jgi:diketogulonate reductase-like aldo/keto reductase